MRRDQRSVALAKPAFGAMTAEAVADVAQFRRGTYFSAMGPVVKTIAEPD
jgi:hypothetical protein